jgi:hypothetical protein
MQTKLIVCILFLAACEAPSKSNIDKQLAGIEERAEQMQLSLDRIEWLAQGVETKTCSYPSRKQELQSNL